MNHSIEISLNLIAFSINKIYKNENFKNIHIVRFLNVYDQKKKKK